ncbi:hypothetical protein LTR37_007673 [Vermiconidia calcicola]|uniref:Uncharacterized protein n=1 Tax=Vermiconidia calcicola TaxID=1690605 RepID=A0ACC3NEE4_9PEZI|nr:hypothetical protein LTR37_007673 [Vermiconidia calcicola]
MTTENLREGDTDPIDSSNWSLEGPPKSYDPNAKYEKCDHECPLRSRQIGSDLYAYLVVADVAHFTGAIIHEQQRRVQYTALSYTWGPADFCRPIIVNGIVFPITENLFACLQHLRHQSNSTYYWIDAICINQLNLPEKAIQVSSMLAVESALNE